MPVKDDISILTKTVPASEPTWICGGGNSITIPIRLHTIDTEETSAEIALVDSGATHSFIDQEYVNMKGWNTTLVKKPIRVLNVDGTPNQSGMIKSTITLRVTYKGEHTERMTFGVVNLGKATLILGHNWLKKHNPEVDWETGKIKMTRCPPACRHARRQ